MGKQAHALEKQEKDVLLDAAGVDPAAAVLTEALGQADVQREEGPPPRAAPRHRGVLRRLRPAATTATDPRAILRMTEWNP